MWRRRHAARLRDLPRSRHRLRRRHRTGPHCSPSSSRCSTPASTGSCSRSTTSPIARGSRRDQAALTTWLARRAARAQRRHPMLRSCPRSTSARGRAPTSATLADQLPPDVDVFWTGPTVCSPTITAADARAWRDAIGGRPLLLWDNYPVNDAVMERELHLGPVPGPRSRAERRRRRRALQPDAPATRVVGRARHRGRVPRRPGRLRRVRGVGARASRTPAGPRQRRSARSPRACCDGPLAEPALLPAAQLVDAVDASIDSPDWAAPVAALRDELLALRDAARTWDATVDPLAAEVSPWLDQARREADAGLAALRLLQQTHAVARSTRPIDRTATNPIPSQP